MNFFLSFSNCQLKAAGDDSNIDDAKKKRGKKPKIPCQQATKQTEKQASAVQRSTNRPSSKSKKAKKTDNVSLIDSTEQRAVTITNIGNKLGDKN